MAHVLSFPLHPFASSVSAVRLGGFVGSLWRVCDGCAGSGEFGQRLRFSCVVSGEPPSPLLETLIRLTTFLVSDAARACAGDVVAGRIGILVERQPQQVALSVEHDGWSRPPASIGDRSLGWARRIAEANGGALVRQIDWDRTVSRVVLPCPGRHST